MRVLHKVFKQIGQESQRPGRVPEHQMPGAAKHHAQPGPHLRKLKTLALASASGRILC